MITLTPWLSALLLVFFAFELLVILVLVAYFITDYFKTRGDDQDTGRYHRRLQ